MIDVNMAEVQAFFFRAMMEGWVKKRQGITAPHMPGHKAISFREGDLYLVDSRTVTQGSLKSAGVTIIWFKDEPVWIMNYGGLYQKRAIHVLKNALHWNYHKQEFIGGRGPLMYAEGSYVYTNQPRINYFEVFQGREQITDAESKELLGYHEYWGMSLV